MKIITAQNAIGAGGHDAPIQSPQEDLLNGLSVARAIHRLIRAAPDNWSTRVGLYGAWGSGKTSILNLLRQLEERENSLVLSFSAWAVTAESGVIALFYETLEERLKKEGIKFSFKRQARHVTNKVKGFAWLSRLVKVGLEDWSPAPAAVTKIATQAAVGAAAFAVSWAKIDRGDIEALVQQLGGRRVVVFIDDLDRTDPRVLPKTFLALRELLDWPGFTFVLAFDKKVVSKALLEYSAAFGEDVQGFLEKVIDIPFEVPTPDNGQKKRLAEGAFKACCDWMPSNTLDSGMKVLPSQPRRIKLIARMMGALHPSLVRHDSEEIDWLGIFLYLTLVEASRRVADWVVDATIRREDGWSLWARNDDERKKKINEARSAMHNLLNEPVPPADVVLHRKLTLFSPFFARQTDPHLRHNST